MTFRLRCQRPAVPVQARAIRRLSAVTIHLEFAHQHIAQRMYHGIKMIFRQHATSRLQGVQSVKQMGGFGIFQTGDSQMLFRRQLQRLEIHPGPTVHTEIDLVTAQHCPLVSVHRLDEQRLGAAQQFDRNLVTDFAFKMVKHDRVEFHAAAKKGLQFIHGSGDRLHRRISLLILKHSSQSAHALFLNHRFGNFAQAFAVGPVGPQNGQALYPLLTPQILNQLIAQALRMLFEGSLVILQVLNAILELAGGGKFVGPRLQPIPLGLNRLLLLLVDFRDDLLGFQNGDRIFKFVRQFQHRLVSCGDCRDSLPE